MARGALWISENSQGQEMGPITQGELLPSDSYLHLLRAFTVLGPVVRSERMFVSYPLEHKDAFGTFELAEGFQPGAYELQVSDDGSSFALLDGEGILVEEGTLGDPVGRRQGFVWTPPANSFPSGEDFSFSVLTPRDAAINLSQALSTDIDNQGTFIQLELMGKDREKVARILNAVMERHVEVAAELKRAQLDELTGILQQQLDRVERELADAEASLQSYQVQTITLPSEDTGPIAPGLAQTRDPVFGEFFQMRVDLDQLQRDKARLEAAVTEMASSGRIPVESLELIPAVRESSQLTAAMTSLAEARAELAVLLEEYTEEYQPVKDMRDRVETLERVSIPSLTRTLLAQLESREAESSSVIANRANELSQIPPRAIEEARRERRFQIANDFYIELRGRLETASLAAASSIPDVRILDPAAVPFRPTSDPRLQLMAGIFLGALGLGFALVLLLDRMDPKLRDPDDIGTDIGLDMLGTIPRLRQGGFGDGNATAVREAFRELRMKLDFAYGAAKPLVVAVTSPAAAEGKTFVSANLASSFADLGRRTILVDGDTRRGKLHEVLGRSRKPGLTDFLMGNSSRRVIQDTDNAKLHFVGFGSRTPSSPELLNSSHMQGLLAGLKRRYEVVIIDCPPLGAGSDAFILGAHAGSVLVVLRSGTTVKDMAVAKLDSFLRMPVRILGAVLNDFRPNLGQGYYKYYSHYLPGYETGSEEEVEEQVAVSGG
jgi:capsular exopolysaccharide synthesis family protein